MRLRSMIQSVICHKSLELSNEGVEEYDGRWRACVSKLGSSCGVTLSDHVTHLSLLPPCFANESSGPELFPRL